MRQIVKDWCEFCEKGTKFEDGRFYTLFMDGPSKEEIKEIFKYFDQNIELTNRLVKYLYHPKPKIDDVENLKSFFQPVHIRFRPHFENQFPSFNHFLES